MPKDEWGVKRLCGACGARFYDLNRDPVDCPICGATYVPLAAIAGKSKVAAETASPKSGADELEDDEEDDDAVVIEDDAEDDADVADADTGDDVDDDDDDDVLLQDNDDDDDEDDSDLGDFTSIKRGDEET